MTHNKYLIFQFLKDNDPISAKSAAQILPLNHAQTFLLLNFLVISLCYSLASFPFTITPSLLLILFSYHKTCRPYYKVIDHTIKYLMLSIIFKISSNFISSIFLESKILSGIVLQLNLYYQNTLYQVLSNSFIYKCFK